MTRAQRWRSDFDRIGGPDAVTWPAFWITFVTFLAGNLTTGGSISASLGVRIAVVAATQLVMFAPLVLLRFTLLRKPSRPRPWVAIAGFAVACVIRGLFLGWLLSAIGAVQDPLYAYRIASAFVSSGLLLVLVAVVVSSLRAHTRSLEDLITGQRELAETQRRILAEVTESNEDALARVKARLVDELSVLESTQGAASVTELQRLASDVVRPMSHELAAVLPKTDQFATSSRDVHVTWQQAVGQMAKTSPLHPLQTTGVMVVLLSVAALGIFGIDGVTMMFAVCLSLLAASWIANAWLRWLLPRLGTGPGVAIFVGTAVVVGVSSATVGGWVIRDTGLLPTFAFAGGIYVTALLVIIALVNAVLRQQRESEATLTALTQTLRRAVVRLGQTRWLQRKALSRALHGPVQSAVTSEALRLDDALRRGEETSTLIIETRTRLRSIIDVLETDLTDTTSLEVALQRIIGTWAGVCDVRSTVSARAAEALAHDPLSQSAVVDILTEAVSNAVRHARATCVEIDVACESESEYGCDISLTISDNGHPVEQASLTPGLGTQLLNECTLAWSRTVVEDHHILQAFVPTQSPTPV